MASNELVLGLKVDGSKADAVLKKVIDDLKKTQSETQKVEDVYKKMFDDILQQEKSYYEKVKFEDKKYFDWKSDQIKKEVSELAISAEQKLNLERKLIAELTSEQQKHNDAVNNSNKQQKTSWTDITATLSHGLMIYSNLSNIIGGRYRGYDNTFGNSNTLDIPDIGVSFVVVL